MKAHIITLEGTGFLAPTFITVFPWTTFKDCPSYCGAGRGIGDKAVPDTMYFLKVSPACWIHDMDWERATPSWSEFHASNSRFIHNLTEVVLTRSANRFMRGLRLRRLIKYYEAVDIMGADIFWDRKREQWEEGLWEDWDGETRE